MTFPLNPSEPDQCGNAQVRQQTGAALLLDCRAYELRLGRQHGGYDVQSDLIPGQDVLTAEPGAPDRVLYSVHFGGFPEYGRTDQPRARPVRRDPWRERLDHSVRRDSGRRDPIRRTLRLAPGGVQRQPRHLRLRRQGICGPCFADGSTGIPVHLPDGSPGSGHEGLARTGARIPRPPARRQAALRRRHPPGLRLDLEVRARRQHSGDVTIYDRNLDRHDPRRLEDTDRRRTMTGPGIAELDISPTARGSWSANRWSHPTPRGTPTGTST